MAKYQKTTQDRIEQAERMIAYFQNLTAGGSYSLDLYMAMRWRKYLSEDQHDMEEITLFARVLEDGGSDHGSGWHELTWSVRQWVFELEEHQSPGGKKSQAR